MGPLFSRFWHDPDFAVRVVILFFGIVSVVLPTLPLGDLGVFGWWASKVVLPIAVVLAALTGRQKAL